MKRLHRDQLSAIGRSESRAMPKACYPNDYLTIVGQAARDPGLLSGIWTMKTKQFNLAEAKAKLSHLVDQAARGELVVIAKAGLPVAKLGPLEAEPKKIKFGVLAGKLSKPALA